LHQFKYKEVLLQALAIFILQAQPQLNPSCVVLKLWCCFGEARVTPGRDQHWTMYCLDVVFGLDFLPTLNLPSEVPVQFKWRRWHQNGFFDLPSTVYSRHVPAEHK